MAEKLGYVPQNIFLTDDTLKNNIAFAVPDNQVDHKKIINAAKLAELENYISTLPDKYNTYVGEKGIRISGGQIKECIARALYYNPEIIVLDEATSALDNLTEKILWILLKIIKK